MSDFCKEYSDLATVTILKSINMCANSMKETFETPESFTEIVVVFFLVCSLWIDLRHGPFLLLNLFEIISDFESLRTETFKQAQMT